jgi:cytochrome c oxidase subunit 2
VSVANNNERRSLGPSKLHVTIVAFQWCWDFEYLHTPVDITGSCSRGYPTLVVPAGETIEFSLISDDVVHEWWLPESRYKEEAFPHHFNNFQLRFSTTGRWEGRCDEFCGLYHDRMDFSVRAVSPPAFARWLRTRQAHAGSGSRYT